MGAGSAERSSWTQTPASVSAIVDEGHTGVFGVAGSYVDRVATSEDPDLSTEWRVGFAVVREAEHETSTKPPRTVTSGEQEKAEIRLTKRTPQAFLAGQVRQDELMAKAVV